MPVGHGTRAAVACKRCRERKVKCDLAKPTCGTCRARGDDCGGYHQRRQIKWMKPSAFSPPAVTKRSSTSPKTSRTTSPKAITFSRPHSAQASCTASPSDQSSLVSSHFTSSPTESQWSFPAVEEPPALVNPVWQARPSKYWDSAILEISSASVSSSAALTSAFDIYLPSNMFRSIAMQQPYWTLPQAYEQHAMQSLELVQTGKYPLLQQTLNCIVLVFWGRKFRRHDFLSEAAAQYATVLRGVREVLMNTEDAGVTSYPLPVFVMLQFCIWIEKVGISHQPNAAVHALGMLQLAISLNLHQTDPSTFQELMTIARPISFAGSIKTRLPSSACTDAWLYRRWFRPRPGELPSPHQVLIDAAAGLPALLRDIDNVFTDHPTNRFSRIAALRQYLERAEQLHQGLTAFEAAHPLQGQYVPSLWDCDGALGPCYSPHGVDEAQWWLSTCCMRQVLCKVFMEIRQLLIKDLGETDPGARALRIGLDKDYASLVNWIEQALAAVERCADWALGIHTVSTASIMLKLSWTRLQELAQCYGAATARAQELTGWHEAAMNAMDSAGFLLDVCS